MKYVFVAFYVLYLISCSPLDPDLIRSIKPASPQPKWSQYISGINNKSGVLGTTFNYIAPTRMKGNFAIQPVTNDIYFIDKELGLMRYYALTGLLETFIPAKYQATGDLTFDKYYLPENGEVLPINAGMPDTWSQVEFDNNGKLYLIIPPTPSTADLGYSSVRVYQIDTDSRQSRLYLGGGVSNTTTATPLEINVMAAPTVFDESNSMYFFSPCNINTGISPPKLMKVTQTASGTAGNISHIAGNCTSTNPTSGASATSTGLGNGSNLVYSSLAVWNNGQAIYFNHYGLTGTYKILANGNVYSTALPAVSTDRGLAYNPVTSKLLVVHNNGAIREFTPSLAGANGETESVDYFARSDGTGQCNADGVDALSACAFASLTIRVRTDGQVFYLDGLRVNFGGVSTIRYKDNSNKLNIVIGAFSFKGHLANRSAAQVYAGGLYYKNSSESNQESFPAGLYFTDSTGQVFARVDEATDTVENIWGTQAPGFSTLHASGTTVGPDLVMGVSYVSNGMAFTFDQDGLPWLRYNRSLISLTASRTILTRQTAQTTWDAVAASATVANAGLSVDAGIENFNLKGQGLFILGRFSGTSPFLRLFDFENNINRHIMGGVDGTVPATDSTAVGTLSSTAVSADCIRNRCPIQFFENSPDITTDDILYYAEGKKLRAIIDPTVAANNFLYTVFTTPHMPVSGTYSQIINFSVSPDQTKVFYLLDNYDPTNPVRNLYCRQLIDTGDAWCDDNTPLELPSSLPEIPQSRIANQFTWKDNNTLFISFGYYGIFKVLLP